MDENTKRVIPTPVSPEETISIESLGGPVLVRGTSMLGQSRILRATRDEEEKGYSATAYMLSICCFLPDGSSIYTPEQWDVWGGGNREDADKLADVCLRMVGLKPREVEKK